MDQTPFLHPSRRAYRFLVLLFVALLTYGSYFAYDSIGAIAPTLIKDMGVDRGAIGATYTLYSVAAILSVFFGGFLLDRIGTRKASLLFSSLVVLGAVIVALAPSMPLIYAGRFVFGAGSECLVVSQSAIIARWFKGKELALAFGISLTISRLGTIFSFNTEELIAAHFGHYRYALWAAVIFCVLSLLANLAYNGLDLRAERALKLEEGEAGDKIVLSDIRKFKPSYWFITILCFCFYSAIFPFTALSTDFFHTKWGLPQTADATGGFLRQVFANFLHMYGTAGGVTTIVIFASMVFAPFAGGLVDKIGRRSAFMVGGSLLVIPAFLLMGFTDVYPAWPMIALGAAFVLVPAALWPAVPLTVDKARVGTAFGLLTMIQNIGLAAFPYLNGKLVDVTQSYTSSMVMFASLGFVALVFALLLRRADAMDGGVLDRPKISGP